MLHQTIVHYGTLLKSVSAVGFSENPSFWETVSFHREMFGVTNFGLLRGVCIVHVDIFIKIFGKLVQGPQNDNFDNVDKIMPSLFFRD